MVRVRLKQPHQSAPKCTKVPSLWYRVRYTRSPHARRHLDTCANSKDGTQIPAGRLAQYAFEGSVKFIDQAPLPPSAAVPAPPAGRGAHAVPCCFAAWAPCCCSSRSRLPLPPAALLPRLPVRRDSRDNWRADTSCPAAAHIRRRQAQPLRTCPRSAPPPRARVPVDAPVRTRPPAPFPPPRRCRHRRRGHPEWVWAACGAASGRRARLSLPARGRAVAGVAAATVAVVAEEMTAIETSTTAAAVAAKAAAAEGARVAGAATARVSAAVRAGAVV